MSAINVNSITGRTGTHGPVLTGVTTVTGGTLNTAALNVTGAASFSGNVSIAGTLSYEDVTDIDSVGIITAQSGINISGGDLTLPDSIIHAGDTNTKIRFPAADTFTVETGGSERLRIESGGDVGIGTVNPSRRLHVTDYGDHGVIRIEGSGNTKRSGIEFYRETSAGVGKGGAAIWVESDTSNSSGKLRFGTASNAGIQSQNTAMILDNNGRLGIGTDSPSNFLHVKNYTVASNYITAENTTAGNAGVRLKNSQGDYAIFANAELIFYDLGNDVERLRITSGGSVGINTNDPQKTLHVNSSDDNSFGIVRISGKNRGGQLEFCTDATKTAGIYSPTSSNELVFFTSSSETERLRITSGGNVNNLGNVGVQTSYPTSSTLVGAASSLIGMYVGDGHMLFSDNLSRSGGYYIPNGLNALNAGPVTLNSTMTLDGVWVIV